MARRNNYVNGEATPMEPGERDRVVVIQQIATPNQKSGRGAPVDNWTTLATVFMRKMDATGREQHRAAQESASVDTQWEMGYREDMDPDLVDVAKLRRLVYQGRIFDIRVASQIGRREGIELLTLAGSKVPA